MKKKIAKVKKMLEASTVTTIDWKGALSTGTTLGNLAMSGRTKVGIPKGIFVLFVGDTDSGKTYVCHAILAEAAKNPAFDDYTLVYDNVELAPLDGIRSGFGQKLNERIQPPGGYTKEGAPVNSKYIEDFYRHASTLFKAGPTIYILDSTDALYSLYAEKKFSQQMSAQKKRAAGDEDAKAKGSYGDGKAKYHSEHLRSLVNLLEKHGSILIIINQTRQNIGWGAMFQPRIRSGGDALEFYASVQLWSKRLQKIRKLIHGKKKQQGIMCQINVKRSRLTGKNRTVKFPIYFSSGVDETGSMVDWLLEEKHWKKRGGQVHAEEFEFVGTVEKLVRHIEKNGLEGKLRCIVRDVWNEIEEQLKVHRKPRYE